MKLFTGFLAAVAIFFISTAAHAQGCTQNGLPCNNNSLTKPQFTANSEAADVTGTFTNSTQSTAISNTNADGYATALISIHGTYGTATATFLQSDDGGVTSYPVLCYRTDGTGSELGYTSLTNVSREWVCPVSGNDTVMVQSSAVASGTVSVRIGITSPSPGQVGGTTVNQTTASNLQGTMTPVGVTTTVTNSTIATGNTYQSALAASATRIGCLITNKSTATELIFIGATGSATAAKSLILNAGTATADGGSFSCGLNQGAIITDQISITSATSTSAYNVISQ